MLETSSALSARSMLGNCWHGQSADWNGSPKRSKTGPLSENVLYSARAATAQLGFSSVTAYPAMTPEKSKRGLTALYRGGGVVSKIG